MRLWSGCEGLWGNWTRSACSQDQAGVLCDNKGRRERERGQVRKGRQRGERGERQKEGGVRPSSSSQDWKIGGGLPPFSLRAPKTAGNGEGWKKKKKKSARVRERECRKREQREREREKEAESWSLKQKAVIRLAATLAVTSGNDRSSVELRWELCTKPFLLLSHSLCHSSSFRRYTQQHKHTHKHTHSLVPLSPQKCFEPIPLLSSWSTPSLPGNMSSL